MKLTDHLHLLRLDFDILLGKSQKLPRFVNVLLILDEKITLIDSGVKESADQIFNYIRQQGRDPLDIGHLVLSHGHPDHIGSTARIKEITGCKVSVHPSEKEWIEDIDIQFRQRPVPGFYHLVNTPVIPDGLLEHGQVIKAGKSLTFRVIHSPGHSKGSLNFFFDKEKIFFTADSIPLKNDIPNYDDFPDLMRSLAVIKNTQGHRTLLTSWTPPVNDRKEMDRLISEGEEYMHRIDSVVKSVYIGRESDPLAHCRQAVEMLGLPPFLVHPVVNNAFRSHLKRDH